MKTIELNQIGEILDAAPLDMSLLFIGDTGIGKTQSIKKYCEERNMKLKVLILSQIEASECLGIPIHTTKEVNGKTYNTIETALPGWVFELAEAENPVLYLDEFLCAEPAVMNSFLNFLSEKEVGGIDLHHVKVIASTNIGNYTFDPDNNILSRFCMFYVENSSFNQYLRSKYGLAKANMVYNDYKDETDKTNNVFAARSLKPRCQEQLLQVKKPELLAMFYEGFTNQAMTPRFHSIEKITNIVAGIAKKTDSGIYVIEDSALDTLAGMIYKAYPRLKSYVKVCTFNSMLRYDKSALIRKCQELKDNFDANKK